MSDRGTPGKPSTTEEEYFVREDAEKKRKIALQAKKETEAAELKRLKELHYLHCPKCGFDMQVVKYHHHDVEVCFSCNGIFLDQGELEAIVAREKSGVMSAVLNWFKPTGG